MSDFNRFRLVPDGLKIFSQNICDKLLINNILHLGMKWGGAESLLPNLSVDQNATRHKVLVTSTRFI